MATLTTSYQKIGTSGSVSFGGASAYLELYAKYNSQSIASNSTEYRIYARLVVTSGYIGEYTGATLSLSGDGLSSSQNLGTGNFNTGDLGDAVNGTVTHNSDGTKSISASATVTFRAWNKSITVSSSATLPTIPRYATVTTSTSSVRETTVNVSWSSNAAVDQVQYRLNGGTWVNVEVNVNKTSGSYTISGLSANTSYTIDFDYKRRDSQLWSFSAGYSGSKSITTYNYPYCTNSPNFTIGNNLALSFYNPLGRNITVSIIGADGTVQGSDTTTGTSINGYNNSGWQNWWYSTIPNAKSGKYKVKVTYGSVVRTRDNGNTYSINESVCKPTFSDFTYYDNDSTITPLTSNNQILVNGNSDCIFTISTANKAVAKNGASMSKYLVQWGNGSNEISYSSTEDVSQHVYDNTGGTLKVTAYDSRGLTTTVTKTATYVPYTSAVINKIETQRKDGVDAKTYIKGKFSIFNGSWNASDSADSMNRLKYVGYSVYINNTWSTYYDITSEILNAATVNTNGSVKTYEFDFDDNIQIHANGSSGGFTVGTEYQIKFLIKDGNSTATFTPYSYQALYETVVSDGTVAMCLHKDSNGLYHYGMNCMSDDDYMFKANDVPILGNNGKLILDLIYPVGSIYMNVSKVDPGTLFGGTWERIQGRFLLCATNDNGGATGGNSSISYTPAGTVNGHTLTISEIPAHKHRERGFYRAKVGASGTDVGEVRARPYLSGDPWDSPMENTGGGGSHNHGFTGTKATLDILPPYLTVYTWKRTA